MGLQLDSADGSAPRGTANQRAGQPSLQEYGEEHVTHLYPGRGSVERAINAVIVDASTEWKHDSALEIAYRYYYLNHRFDGIGYWPAQLNQPANCGQDACYGTLTHGFAAGEVPEPPPVVPAPTERTAMP